MHKNKSSIRALHCILSDHEHILTVTTHSALRKQYCSSVAAWMVDGKQLAFLWIN